MKPRLRCDLSLYVHKRIRKRWQRRWFRAMTKIRRIAFPSHCRVIIRFPTHICKRSLAPLFQFFIGRVCVWNFRNSPSPIRPFCSLFVGSETAIQHAIAIFSRHHRRCRKCYRRRQGKCSSHISLLAPVYSRRRSLLLIVVIIGCY